MNGNEIKTIAEKIKRKSHEFFMNWTFQSQFRENFLFFKSFLCNESTWYFFLIT